MTTKTIRFMKHYVTDGANKARVHYSAGTYTDGGYGVTLYAKKYRDEEALSAIFAERVVDNSDITTDYFEKARVRIDQADPLFAAVILRVRGGK